MGSPTLRAPLTPFPGVTMQRAELFRVLCTHWTSHAHLASLTLSRTPHFVPRIAGKVPTPISFCGSPLGCVILSDRNLFIVAPERQGAPGRTFQTAHLARQGLVRAAQNSRNSCSKCPPGPPSCAPLLVPSSVCARSTVCSHTVTPDWLPPGSLSQCSTSSCDTGHMRDPSPGPLKERPS